MHLSYFVGAMLYQCAHPRLVVVVVRREMLKCLSIMVEERLARWKVVRTGVPVGEGGIPVI